MPVSKIPVKIRRLWQINPATRIKKSKKVYSRRKLKEEIAKITKDAEGRPEGPAGEKDGI
jgi:hypothetical protein